jgi:hypothetical protein
MKEGIEMTTEEAADAFVARADERERFYCGFGVLP